MKNKITLNKLGINLGVGEFSESSQVRDLERVVCSKINSWIVVYRIVENN